MKLTFSHVGIPTGENMPGEQYEKFFNLNRADAKWSPFHIEYLRFEDRKLLPEILSKMFHIGMEVDSIEEALPLVDEVVVPIIELGEERICFVKKDGVIFELIQKAGEDNQK